MCISLFDSWRFRLKFYPPPQKKKKSFQKKELASFETLNWEKSLRKMMIYFSGLEKHSLLLFFLFFFKCSHECFDPPFDAFDYLKTCYNFFPSFIFASSYFTLFFSHSDFKNRNSESIHEFLNIQVWLKMRYHFISY